MLCRPTLKVTIGLSSIQWFFIVANKWHYLSMRMFIRISCELYVRHPSTNQSLAHAERMKKEYLPLYQFFSKMENGILMRLAAYCRKLSSKGMVLVSNWGADTKVCPPSILFHVLDRSTCKVSHLAAMFGEWSGYSIIDSNRLMQMSIYFVWRLYMHITDCTCTLY
jgi:hypothetical protein